MKSVFENGKLRHIAYCEKSGNTARKPKDLMENRIITLILDDPVIRRFILVCGFVW